MKNNLEEYCISHSEPESKIQVQIREYTYKNEIYPQMISGPIVTNFLSSLIRSINAKRILEIGMFTGYSAVSMAQTMKSDGQLHTCEQMEEHVKTATKFISKSKLKDIIKIHHAPAIDTLETFKVNSFDFIFIDADKINYLNYYLMSIHLLKSNGIIVLDNMLWSGEVLHPQDDASKKLRETGDYIQNDQRVINMLYPIRDGLMVCYKK